MTALGQKLQSQGFTNVQVVPGSFLVSAKDKDGDPVNMVIGPHSMTMFTSTSANESNSSNDSNSSGNTGASSGTGTSNQ